MNISGGSMPLRNYGPTMALTTVGPRKSFHNFGTVLSGSRWNPFPRGYSFGNFPWTVGLDMVPYTGPALVSRPSRILCSDLGG